MTELDYASTRGKCSTSGPEFEINMAIWLLLKGLRRKTNFFLGCNVGRFGNFDDLCFKYKLNGTWHLILMQLKHKDEKGNKKTKKMDTCESPKLDENFFYDKNSLLTKCYESYLDIVKNIKKEESVKKCDVFSGVKAENVHYIIFTNGCLPKKIKLTRFNEKAVVDCLAINPLEHSSYKLSESYYRRCIALSFINYCKSKKIKSKYEDVNLNKLEETQVQEIHELLEKEEMKTEFNKFDFEDFLNKLIIFQEQPNAKNLSTFNYDEIVEMSDENCEMVYHNIETKMAQWHAESKTALSSSTYYDTLQQFEKDKPFKPSFFNKLEFNDKHFIPRSLISSDEYKTIKVDRNIFDLNNFTLPLVIVADAGQGKTTIVNYLSQLHINDVTIVSIKLGRICKLFKQVQIDDNTDDNCRKFLESCLKYKNAAKYNKLLKFGKNDKFFLLLDAYDELDFDDKVITEKTNNLIQVLSKNFNILLTTRNTNETKKLESLLNCNTYSIIPFDLKQQMEFARYFFRNQAKPIRNDSKLVEYIGYIFSLVQNQSFFKNPLHLEMLLGLFLKNYDNDEPIDSDIEIKHLYDLYLRFIEKKIESYLDRYKIGECQENLKERHRLEIFADHIYYAKQFFKDLNKETHKLSLNHNELLKIGFMSKISECGKEVEFVHNTFADFFYTYQVIKDLETNKTLNMKEAKMFFNDFTYQLLNSKFLYESKENFKLLNDCIESINGENKYQVDILGRNRLHIAVMVGAKKITKFLMTDRQCLTTRDLFGATPFLYAFKTALQCLNNLNWLGFKENSDLIVEMLKRKSCPINIPDKLFLTCIHYAVPINLINIIKLLLKNKDCPINVQNTLDGCTALQLAIQCNIDDAAILLINDKRSNLSLTNILEETCLHVAVRKNNFKVVELLLTKENCPLNSKNINNQTALHVAVANNFREIVTLLLDSSCDCNILDFNQATPLHYAIRDKKIIDIAKILIDHKNLDMSLTRDDLSYLHLAVGYNNIEFITLLLKRQDCPVDCQTKKNRLTALQIAIVDNKDEAAILLINDKKSNLSLTNIFEETCLHVAVKKNNFKTVELLLTKKNCPLNSKNIKNQTALHVAVANNFREIVTLLLDAGCNCNILDFNQATPLHYAIMDKKLIDIAKILINHKDLDISLTNHLNVSYLHFAVAAKNINVTKLLLEREDCPINIQTHSTKETYLHAALQTNKDIDLIEVLLKDARCPIDAQNADKQTALHYAVDLNLPFVVKLLLNVGCDRNIKDKNQATPLDYALSKRNLEIVDILKQK